MLEIKTITNHNPYFFDKAVNEALADGWDLVRRDCFIAGPDRDATLYAELERITDEPEEEEYDIDAEAQWVLTRNPRTPYKCSNCGYTANEQWTQCPECKRKMRPTEE